MPVLETLLLGPQQRFRRVAVLVKVFGEAALAAGEVDERDFLAGFRVLVPVFLDGRVGLERQTGPDRVTLAWIVDQKRERAAVDGQTSLVAGHVVGDAVLGLAGRIAHDDGRS